MIKSRPVVISAVERTQLVASSMPVFDRPLLVHE